MVQTVGCHLEPRVSLFNFLLHAPPDLILRPLVALGAAGGLLMLLGRWRARRSWVQLGAMAVVWPVAVFLADVALVYGIEPRSFDSPARPLGVGAPGMALALLGVGAGWGALARRWRPWPGIWWSAAAAIPLPVAVTCWGQLDRTVIDWVPRYPACMPMVYSLADLSWRGGASWIIVAGLSGLLAVAAAALSASTSTRAIRLTSNGLLVGALGLTLCGVYRGCTAPQPDAYVGSLPVVGRARPGRPATLAEMGYDTPEAVERERRIFERSADWTPEPWTRYTIEGQAPAGLTLYTDESDDLVWSWSDGGKTQIVRQGLYGGPIAPTELQIVSDAGLDVWLIVLAGRPIALLDRALDGAPVLPDEEALWARALDERLPWARVAQHLAPPTAWTWSAGLSLLAAALLRRERVSTEAGERTLAAMQIAILSAGCTPLLVAAWRGFVWPW